MSYPAPCGTRQRASAFSFTLFRVRRLDPTHEVHLVGSKPACLNELIDSLVMRGSSGRWRPHRSVGDGCPQLLRAAQSRQRNKQEVTVRVTPPVVPSCTNATNGQQCVNIPIEPAAQLEFAIRHANALPPESTGPLCAAVWVAVATMPNEPVEVPSQVYTFAKRALF